MTTNLNLGYVIGLWFCRYRRTTHVTPKSYLSFLDGYKGIYKENHHQLAELAQRMNTGLDKLKEAGESVTQLSKELVVKEKDLAAASAKADTASARPQTLSRLSSYKS